MNAWDIRWDEGTSGDSLLVTTSLAARFLRGTAGGDVVALLVKVGTAPETGNPVLWRMDPNGKFVLPDPAAYPDGLPLLDGDNTVVARPVLASGEVGAPITALIRRVSTVSTAPPSPTAIRAERRSQSVVIEVECPMDPALKSLRYYVASAPRSGGASFSLLVADVGFADEASDEVVVSQVEAQVGPQAGEARVTALIGDVEHLVGTLDLGDDDTPVRVQAQAVRRHTRRISRYEHDRTVPTVAGLLGSLPLDVPLWYAASCVFDAEGIEVEGPLSEAVSSAPLTTLPLGPVTLPVPSRQAIAGSLAPAILRRQPGIDVKPGSFWDDAFVVPVSAEIERVRFVLDFANRARSARALLQVDDPDLTGTSVPVSESSYKQSLRDALFLPDDPTVQRVIDRAFEALASNLGITREQGTRAEGPVQVVSSQRPTTSINIGAGTRIDFGGRAYVVTVPGSIPVDGLASTYDPSTGRYVTEVRAEAEVAGNASNVAAGERGTIEGQPDAVAAVAASDLLGDPPDSNAKLTERIERALGAVDSGTVVGIEADAAGTSGVEQVFCVDRDHPLYRRGPCGTDVWVYGTTAPVRRTETFVFDAAVLRAARAVPVGDPRRLRFRVEGASEERPLLYVIDNRSRSLGARNMTRGYWFDLTNVQVSGPDTFDLDPLRNDPGLVGQADEVSVDVRLRVSSEYVTDRQPVRSISSLTGEETGLLDPSTYVLSKRADPLLKGRSTVADDSIVLRPPPPGQLVSVGIPSLSVSGERHVVLDGPEPLGRLGVDPTSIVVRDPATGASFRGPLDPVPPGAGDPDWDVEIPATSRDPLVLRFARDGKVRPGDAVLIDYAYDQNFVVEYMYEGIVSSVQQVLGAQRHADSNPLAKIAVEVPVDLKMTVVLRHDPARPVSVSRSSAAILTALSRLFAPRRMGEAMRISEVVAAVNDVPDVSYVVQPLALQGRSYGSLVLAEAVADVGWTRIDAWSGDTVTAYLSPLLAWPPQPGGGTDLDPVSVRVRLVPVTTVTQPPTASGEPFRSLAPSAYVVEARGLVIPGVSDDATLASLLPPDSTDPTILAERASRSGQRVIVFLPREAPPPSDVEVTYVTADPPREPSDVEVGLLEKVVLGQVEILFNQERR